MGLFEKLKASLSKTSAFLREGIDRALRPGAIGPESFEEIEALLIQVDVGVKAAGEIVEEVKERLKREKIQDPGRLVSLIEEKVAAILSTTSKPLRVSDSPPTVYLLVGVNGSGKTTTAAKLAYRWTSQGKTAIAAACDTFRAAAAEQLEVWSRRVGMEIIKHQEGSDPAAVAFDAAHAALARRKDLLVVDTAGRLHTKKNLMEELRKVVRVIAREIPGAPHEILLVIDGTTGQNGLIQARVFTEAVGVTGVVLTKLDGSAKGGIAVAIAGELGLPIKLVGVGEGLDDLKDFDPAGFAKALFAGDRSDQV
ncbi:MAG TPA: signal recognition particle-docking protein FtsY [Firmicutes bacterium]|nr:signal recognition particle-docking protein FtsY [Candidatus Fermentithermobacillaceae bacterium]